MSTGPTVSVATAAQLTGLSKKAIRRRIERGTLQSTLLEGHHHIPITELRRSGLLDQRPPTGMGDGGGPAEGSAGEAADGEDEAPEAATPQMPYAEAGPGTPAVIEALDDQERRENRAAAPDQGPAGMAEVGKRLEVLERRLSALADAQGRLESTVGEVEVRLIGVQTHQRSLGAHLHQMQAWIRTLPTQRKSRFLRRHRG